MTTTNKYHAKPERVGGFRFASRREAKRYGELQLLEKAGQIKGLMPHPSYPLHVNGVLVGRYTADFSYMEGGKAVAEDTKSPPTRTEAYKLRTRVFQALYPDIEFREVM